MDEPTYAHLSKAHAIGLADEAMTLPKPLAEMHVNDLLARVQLAHALLELAKLIRSTVPVPNPYRGQYEGKLAFDPFGAKEG